jgi:YidC/Oxa1 family membrane protein insertase
MQKLQTEQGFNPLSGCLPMLVQVPVFIGLFHVLNGFKPGAPGNFVFNAADVASFVEADLFGAKLSNTLSQPAELLATFGTDRLSMMTVAVPLMIAAAIATHFTARHSLQRQSPEAAASPQAAMTNKLMLWIFPMFAIVGGPFLPLAILIYWLANNFWTLGQQRVVYRRIDREEAASADAPAVVNSAGAASAVVDTTTAEKASDDQPGEIPGVIEDRARDTDKPGETR